MLYRVTYPPKSSWQSPLSRKANFSGSRQLAITLELVGKLNLSGEAHYTCTWRFLTWYLKHKNLYLRIIPDIFGESRVEFHIWARLWCISYKWSKCLSQKKQKWHLLCCCHDNSYATGAVLIKTEIPSFCLNYSCKHHLLQLIYSVMMRVKTIWEPCLFHAGPSVPL